eukprot:PITA_36468
MSTAKHLNVLPLGSYNMILGMDWLYLHRTKVDFSDKAIKCVDDNGEKRTLQGKKKPTSIRMVTVVQAKRSYRRGCVMFVVHISSDNGKEVEDVDVLRKYLVLHQFLDVFLEDISKLQPHREVDFSIELAPRTAPALKAPYRMSTLELVELKLYVKEMLDKEYIIPNVSPLGTPVLFIKKKYGTLRLCINYRNARSLATLSELDFKIRCIKGKENQVADGLSKKVKAECKHRSGVLQPIAILKWKWEVISMEFITGLMRTVKKHDSIMVVVDRLRKVSHFIPVKTTYSTNEVAQVFIREIVRLHGVLKKIATNRDAKFTFKFWKKLFAGLDTELAFNIAYHQ